MRVALARLASPAAAANSETMRCTLPEYFEVSLNGCSTAPERPASSTAACARSTAAFAEQLLLLTFQAQGPRVAALRATRDAPYNQTYYH